MKKIKSDFNQKDRVVCVTVQGGHEFYYQPVGSKERILLFVTDDFSHSVFAYFRDKGRNMTGRGFSITLKELYQFHDYHNVKLAHTLERIPIWIDYILKNNPRILEQTAPVPVPVHTIIHERVDERAA